MIISRKTSYRDLRKGGKIVIGDTLKRTRMIYGYKASEMSELLQISKSYLSEIENNKKKTLIRIVRKILRNLWNEIIFINFII